MRIELPVKGGVKRKLGRRALTAVGRECYPAGATPGVIIRSDDRGSSWREERRGGAAVTCLIAVENSK
jgi:hypothetical protein